MYLKQIKTNHLKEEYKVFNKNKKNKIKLFFISL